MTTSGPERVRPGGSSRSALAMIGRAELGGRLGSVLVLAAVTAVVVAVVLATVAGARRTLSATDRFVDATGSRDLLAYVSSEDIIEQPGEIDRVAAAVETVDGVEEVHVQRGYWAVADIPYDFVVMTSPDGSVFTDIDRPVLLDGRMPREDEVDEVLLNESAADLLGLGVGDRLRLPTATPGYMMRLAAGGVTEAEPELDGPVLDLEVVGVGRQGDELLGDLTSANPAALATPAFDRRYVGEVASPVAVLPLRARVDVDVQAVIDVLDELDLRGELFATTVEEDWLGAARSTNRVVAVSTLVAAAVALVAGAVVLAQMVLRQTALSAPLAGVAGPLGLTRHERRLVVGAPAGIAVATGTVAGTVMAVGLSPLFPLSRARLAEPRPGLAVDAAVVGAGGAAALALGLLLCWVATRAAIAPNRRRLTRNPRLTTATTGLLRPPTALGVRMATRRTTTEGAIPVRSTMVGAVVGVAGVMAIGVVVASIGTTIDEPERLGWTWSSRPDLFAEDPYATAAAIAEEEGVAAAAEQACALLPLDGTTTYTCAIRSMVGSTPPVITDGRAPVGPGEVALTRRGMERSDVALGGTVVGHTTAGDPVELVVVGETVIYGNDSQPAALVDMEGIEALWPESLGANDGRALLLSYDEGVDAEALEARLASSYEVAFPVYTKPEPPGRLSQMERMRPLFVTLAIFLGGLGAVGLIQFLALSVRRRRSQFAVLRTLGFRRREVRRAVTWQAVVAAGVGVVVGVPLGVALGRTAWHLAIGGLDILDLPATPWVLAATVVLGSVLGAALVAQVPGWFAGRRRPAEVLRTE